MEKMMGKPSAADVTDVNKTFYNEAYRSRSPIVGLLHTLVSYDQQSKSKRNFAVAKSLIAAVRRRHKEVRVLDYGFGHGSFLLKVPGTVEAYGCDIATEAINKYRGVAKLLGKTTRVATLEDFPSVTAGKKFDIIMCSHVLEHVPDDGAVVGEFGRMLGEGGRLVLNLPINEVWEDPKHVRAYDEVGVRHLLEGNGFSVESMVRADRLTAFFLRHEQVAGHGRAARIFLRLGRLCLAVLPQGFSNFAERFLSREHLEQQLIIVAAKAETRRG